MDAIHNGAKYNLSAAAFDTRTLWRQIGVAATGLLVDNLDDNPPTKQFTEETFANLRGVPSLYCTGPWNECRPRKFA